MTALPLPPDPNLHLSEAEQRRVELTVSCRDADAIPKVGAAGLTVDQGGVRVQVMHEGTRVLAGGYFGAWMAEIIRRLRGHHEPQEELVVHRILGRLAVEPAVEAPVIVELGSFWAHYAIWGLRAIGGHALLLEPDPAHLEIGRRNLQLNSLEATIVQAAVGGAHGRTTRLVCESDGVERELPVMTIAGLLAEHGFDRIDLLLVDVQGPESDVLARAVGLLRDHRIRFLVVSTHHHSISGDPLTHKRCLETVVEAGAHVIAEHTVGESFSGDGLIAASTAAKDRDLRVEISRCPVRDSLFGEA
jgi:FkbM family methyltransferase